MNLEFRQKLFTYASFGNHIFIKKLDYIKIILTYMSFFFSMLKIDLCKQCSSGGELITCDKCSSHYHIECCEPPLRRVPRGNWLCHQCSHKHSIRDDNSGMLHRFVCI